MGGQNYFIAGRWIMSAGSVAQPQICSGWWSRSVHLRPQPLRRRGSAEADDAPVPARFTGEVAGELRAIR